VESAARSALLAAQHALSRVQRIAKLKRLFCEDDSPASGKGACHCGVMMRGRMGDWWLTDRGAYG
jgi:hypothetical protein